MQIITLSGLTRPVIIDPTGSEGVTVRFVPVGQDLQPPPPISGARPRRLSVPRPLLIAALVGLVAYGGYRAPFLPFQHGDAPAQVRPASLPMMMVPSTGPVPAYAIPPSERGTPAAARLVPPAGPTPATTLNQPFGLE